MNNQELFRLFKHSKLAQVALPLSKNVRGPSTSSPTHQIIYTPKSSALRSDYGMKTALPKQVGVSHIAFNDIDSAKSMPDVEKRAGPLYTRLRFQESEVVLKKSYNKANPLFAWEDSKSLQGIKSDMPESIATQLNMNRNASLLDVKKAMAENPEIYTNFKQWVLENSPESFMLKVPSKFDALLKEFFSTSKFVRRRENSLEDMIKPQDRSKASGARSSVQGTAGLSYLQRGRLINSPNGIKHGSIVPGRLLGEREATIGGFVANVNEKTTLLQANYAKNSPGKHPKQFVLPFKVNEAEITANGSVRLQADGVKVGSWMLRSDLDSDSDRYPASNPNFGSLPERSQKEFSFLENVLGLTPRSRS
ncbi:mitochondrial ribosomal protein L51 [Metschnikowia bicuspidata var. bicuspidata NRRL YB-4993]|uniref:Mitochondrial ribosomal protein L51 n=1 Tax=Metschnikowia bicuspidata var. bicuspidata NRRL YB-4993 TaxID=869754 RepID=A0A1A0HFF4_9ASCO|nr:mitochondrial ribosomal protein L51 [Metschnikowia bicuspidata var. bicuspidata NRRL YB-4993]OBA22879.1 mitochondrial ribosomal protein L51 [Metschnikowia bicuspidata var. bicuspidata NRRL YB-4993]